MATGRSFLIECPKLWTYTCSLLHLFVNSFISLFQSLSLTFLHLHLFFCISFHFNTFIFLSLSSLSYSAFLLWSLSLFYKSRERNYVRDMVRLYESKREVNTSRMCLGRYIRYYCYHSWGVMSSCLVSLPMSVFKWPTFSFFLTKPDQLERVHLPASEKLAPKSKFIFFIFKIWYVSWQSSNLQLGARSVCS